MKEQRDYFANIFSRLIGAIVQDQMITNVAASIINHLIGLQEWLRGRRRAAKERYRFTILSFLSYWTDGKE
jgi:hypothetical protein